MYHRMWILLIAVLCSLAAAEPPPPRLEISEYRLPRVERIDQNQVNGYWEPGWLEFEWYVGGPTRQRFEVRQDRNYRPLNPDTLTRSIGLLPVRSTKVFVYDSLRDAGGNVWTRRLNSRGDDEESCPLYSLLRNDTVVYQLRDCIATEQPLMFLRGEHWWIETWNYKSAEDTSSNWFADEGYQVVADSVLLSDKYGYSQTFDYHFVGGKPFFMFRRDSVFGWNYDGADTTIDFDSVFHGACCEPSCSNPRFAVDQFSFYAKRDSTWYMVVGTVKEK
jgi:hypothetical protein